MIEGAGDLWCSLDDNLEPCNFFAQADKILEAMNERDPDESFLNFLARRFPGDDQADAKLWATGYVSGFNAADPAEVSVHWLIHSRNADEQIQGDRAFRIAGGYQKLLDIFAGELRTLNLPIHLNTVVSHINWSKQSVQVKTSGYTDAVRNTSQVATGGLKPRAGWRLAERAVEHGSLPRSFAAARALITFPLGVLKSGCIHFTPDLPGDKKSALDKLAMGKVVRVTLCFRKRFWAGKHRGATAFLSAKQTESANKNLSNLSFLFSRDPAFPTWWTQMPEHVPIVTGWAPADSAEQLAGLSGARIVDKALDSLGSVLGLNQSQIRSQLNTAYFHDWDSDPFSCGAYSYVKAGGDGCQKTLGAAIDNTLFFAGEATDTSGHNGTVHGAIASGIRAAKEILI